MNKQSLIINIRKSRKWIHETQLLFDADTLSICHPKTLSICHAKTALVFVMLKQP